MVYTGAVPDLGASQSQVMGLAVFTPGEDKR